MNIRMIAPLAGALTAVGLTFAMPSAHAAPRYDQPGTPSYAAWEQEILLSEIADEIDSIPPCALEDGSDLIYPGSDVGRCLWSNDGNVWLTYADRSYLIVDDTGSKVAHGVAAADGGVPGPGN